MLPFLVSLNPISISVLIKANQYRRSLTARQEQHYLNLLRWRLHLVLFFSRLTESETDLKLLFFLSTELIVVLAYLSCYTFNQQTMYQHYSWSERTCSALGFVLFFYCWRLFYSLIAWKNLSLTNGWTCHCFFLHEQ